MNQFIIHSLKAGVFMALLYLVYYLFLSRDTSYLRNRTYLLGSLLASWLLPFIIINIPLKLPSTDFSAVLNEFSAPAATMALTGTGATESGPDLKRVILIIYFTGIGIFIIRFLFTLSKLIKLIVTNPVSNRVVSLRNQSIPSGFSALGFTFVNDSLPVGEKEKIILHENIHNRQFHHIDAIVCEIVIILQWINPFAYLVRYSLRAVHEYQTDREFISTTGCLREYQELIINEIFGTRSIQIASCFSTRSLIKKRILMMTKKETRPGAVIKLCIAIPLIAMAIIFFSCKDNIVIPEDTITAEPAAVIDAFTDAGNTVAGDSSTSAFTFQAENPASQGDTTEVLQIREISRPGSAAYGDMIIVVDGRERTAEFLSQITDSEIAIFRTLKPERALQIYGPRGAAGVVHVTTKAHLASLNPEGRDVFMIVENMPTFRDGDVQKFSQWVKSTVNYPENARQNGIQGKVFIGFIVEPDGTVSTVTVLRSVEKSLDDEAVRAVRSSPKWVPGYQRGVAVPVRFSITVNFLLDNSHDSLN